MEAGLSGTFILSEAEERELAATDGLPRASRQAVRDGRMAGGVRWCWMEVPHLDAVHAFVGGVPLKNQLFARPERFPWEGRRLPRPHLFALPRRGHISAPPSPSP